MSVLQADGAFTVHRPASAPILLLEPEAGTSAMRFVIAGFGDGALPARVSSPSIGRASESAAGTRYRLSCNEGEFDFTARGIELLESRPALFDASLARFALRSRDRSVVGWLLRLLRLPGGAWLLRAWHTRRG